MPRTTPALIRAGEPPTASALYTYKLAIQELQQRVDFSLTHSITATSPRIVFDDIPSDLATLTVYASGKCSDTTFRQEVPLHGFVNEDESSVYRFRYTLIDGNGFTPRIFSESKLASVGYFGLVQSLMSGSYPTTSEVTFGNWGVGTEPLCYTGHINNARQNGLVGGHCDVARPYTTLTLLPSVGQFLAGSIFTISGRYP